jgi:hypothetical protein
MLSQFKGFGNEISGDQKQIQGYQGQLQDVYGGLGGLLSQLPGLQNQLGGYSDTLGQLSQRTGALATPFNKFLAPNSALNAAYADNAETLRNSGALSNEGLRNATQLSRSMSPSGTSNDPSAIARDVLSREDFRQQNLNRALGVSQNILGQQTGATGVLSGLLGQQAGITGQRANITGEQGNLLGLGGNLLGQQAGVAGQGAGLSGLLAGLTGQKAGLLGQQQALQTGGLNQLLGVGNAATSQFGSLTNPVLGYLGNLFSGNQQAAISQAQINAQQDAAGQAKTGSSIGGGLSLIGSIAGIAL